MNKVKMNITTENMLTYHELMQWDKNDLAEYIVNLTVAAWLSQQS